MDTFDANVHRARIAKAQELMKQDGIAALLFTSEANVRYFTGYTSHRWAQPTSPQFGILAQTGDPTLIVNSIEMDRAGIHPWLRSVRDGAPDFVKQVVASIHDVGAAYGRIAAELEAFSASACLTTISQKCILYCRTRCLLMDPTFCGLFE